LLIGDNMKKYLIFLMGIVFFLGGCSTYVPRYSPSVDNVEIIRSLSSEKKINVGPFTSTDAGKSSFYLTRCNPITTSDGKPFADYVRKAFIDELRMAGIYSNDAQLVIKGHLETIDFSSVTGKWFLVLAVSSNTNQSFTVEETYDYSTSFIGTVACNRTTQAFLPAVQNLIKKVLNHPSFQEML